MKPFVQQGRLLSRTISLYLIAVKKKHATRKFKVMTY